MYMRMHHSVHVKARGYLARVGSLLHCGFWGSNLGLLHWWLVLHLLSHLTGPQLKKYFFLLLALDSFYVYIMYVAMKKSILKKLSQIKIQLIKIAQYVIMFFISWNI